MKKILLLVSFITFYNLSLYSQISWITQTSGSVPNMLEAIYFTNANDGFAVGNSIMFKTTNGGSNWTSKVLSGWFMSVCFTDANTGYIVGSNGTIQKTINSGTDWTIQTSGTTNWLYKVSFSDANTGYVVGNYGTILKTNNGGTNWINLTSGTGNCLYSVYFTNANTGFAVGDN